MTPRRTLVLVAGFACLLLVAGTGGFSATDAERGFAVTVAEDESALLAVETRSPALANGNHRDVALATVTNNFPSPIEIASVRVTPGTDRTPPNPTNAASLEPDAPLPVGTAAALVVDVTCGANGGGTEAFTLRISVATGAGTTVELSRTVSVECTGAPAAATTESETPTESGSPVGTESSTTVAATTDAATTDDG